MYAFSDSCGAGNNTERTSNFCCCGYTCCNLYPAFDRGCCAGFCILQTQVSEIVGETAIAAPVCCQVLGKGEIGFFVFFSRRIVAYSIFIA